MKMKKKFKNKTEAQNFIAINHLDLANYYKGHRHIVVEYEVPDETITRSSGCVFCDIELPTTVENGVVGHRADKDGREFVPCPLVKP